MFKKFIAMFLIFISLFIHSGVLFAQETKYPDFAYEFLGEDKYENFNRKVFNFNLLLNKYAIRPIHILWASIMPVYVMDRIQGVTNNIEYPIRLISSLIQKDFKTSKDETVRFFTNTVLGIGGMFDPAKHIFKIEQSKENMEQALAACHVKSGKFFVLPVISFTNMRGLFGKALDCALNPSSYIGTPILAAIKAGLLINRSAFLQPLIKLVESNYADPYEIAKKVFGIDAYIKCKNLDRVDVTSSLNIPVKIVTNESNTSEQEVKKAKTETQQIQDKNVMTKIEVSSEIVIPDLLYGGTFLDNIVNKPHGAEDFKLVPDIVLRGYNPQNPIVDSMRTALFSLPEAQKSIWSEFSIWNRCFANKIKTSSVNLVKGKNDCKYRYIIHPKESENAPLAIILPSIGEGILSSHSVYLAKLFYDAGYSVVIQGSHFQWEFVKSMPDGYHPGLPAQDAQVIRELTGKIIKQLEDKYKRKFNDKIIIGTSFGALITLFTAALEYKDNTLGNARYIAVCPPINLIYAMKQVDKINESSLCDNVKERAGLTSAKAVKLIQSKNDIDFEINNLPFSEDEGKLLTGFLMHQKLSDVIFTIENAPKNATSDIYYKINNMSYQDYAEKYLLSDGDKSCDDLSFETGLNSISYYLENCDNYKIYHSINDYLINSSQLKQLKQMSKDKLILVDNGAHLGFMYRNEFLEDLKQTIVLH